MPRIRHTVRISISEHYELHRPSELTGPMRELFRALIDAPGVAAILTPRYGRALGCKVLDSAGVEQWQLLARSGPLPSAKVQRAALLCLSGVAAVGGISGIQAYRHFFPSSKITTDELSTRALEYAVTLPLTDLPRLAARLYFFNRRPLTAAPQGRALTDLIQANLQKSRETLRADYRVFEDEHWTFFYRRAGKPDGRLGRPQRKLYLCPTLERLPILFPEVIELFATHLVPSFKIGRSRANLLRPDKFVCYLGPQVDETRLIADLRSILAGPSQPLPFAAACANDGSLSRGVDPLTQPLLPWQPAETGRVRIAQLLATQLLLERAEGSSLSEAVQGALHFAREQEIDPSTWSWTEKDPLTLSTEELEAHGCQ